MAIILLSSVPLRQTRGNSVYASSLTNEIKKKEKVFLIQPSFANSKVIKKKLLTIINIKVNKNFNQKEPKFYYNVEREIQKIDKQFNVSIVHILYGHYFKKFISKIEFKLVWTCHNVPPNEYSFEGLKNIFFIRFLLKIFILFYHMYLIYRANYNLIIVNSKRVEKIFFCLKFLLPKIKIIGCGHSFLKILRGNKLKKINEIKLLTIASFKPHKKLENILTLAKQLDIDKIKYKWIILSDKYNDQYQNKILKLKKKNALRNIKFLSKISEKEKNNLYKKSDIYVQTSSEEGFCIPFLEASCHNNLMVLGTPTGAMPEISKIFGCNICFNENEFLYHIKQKLNNNFKQRYISNKKLYEWSWPNIAKKTIDSYNKIK